MHASKVRQWRSVDNSSRCRPQHLLENVTRVRTGDRIHRIELHAKPTFEQFRERVEIKQLGHHRRVVFERIDDYNLSLTQAIGAKSTDINLRMVEGEILRETECPFI